MPTVGIVAILLLPGASPFGECPTQSQLQSALALQDVPTGDGGVQVTGVMRGEHVVELLVIVGEREVQRQVEMTGSCEQRASLLAAVIERAARPLLPKPAVARAPTLAEPLPTASKTVRTSATPATRPLEWHLGAATAGGIEDGGRLRLAAEISYAWSMNPREQIRGLLRAQWRPSRTAESEFGTVRLHEGQVRLGFQWATLPLEPAVFTQIIRAQSPGVAFGRSTWHINPGVAVASCVRPDLGWFWRPELCVDGWVTVLSQQFRLGGEEVTRAPRFAAALRVGGAFGVPQKNREKN